jgi:DNA-binding HxlR family transcriptional regulator
MDNHLRQGAPIRHCPVQAAVELIGRRWSGAIVRTLLAGSVRWSVLHSVPGLSDRLLSERLRELEAEGIVVRTVFPDIPVRIEYRLTEKGLELERLISAVDVWADKWAIPSAHTPEPATSH